MTYWERYYALQLLWERWDASLRWRGVNLTIGSERFKPRFYTTGDFRP